MVLITHRVPTFFITTAPYAYFGVVGGTGPSGILRYYYGKIHQFFKIKFIAIIICIRSSSFQKKTKCTYHFDHLLDGKVFLCEVSCFCKRSIIVVAGGLWFVWRIGT